MEVAARVGSARELPCWEQCAEKVQMLGGGGLRIETRRGSTHGELWLAAAFHISTACQAAVWKSRIAWGIMRGAREIPQAVSAHGLEIAPLERR